MLRFRPITTSKGAITNFKTSTMEQALDLSYSVKKAKASVFWGLVNVVLLSCVIYDLAYKCPLYTTSFNYLEYALAVVFALNVIYHIVRYFFIMLHIEPHQLNPIDKKVLSITETEKYYHLTADQSTSTTVLTQRRPKTPDTSMHNTTMNDSNTYNTSTMTGTWISDSPSDGKLASWRTPNDSQNYSVSSPSWVYYRGSPDQTARTGTPPNRNFRGDESLPEDCISDEKMLKQYLYDYDVHDRVQNANNSGEPPSNLLSTFWAHPVTQTQHEVSVYLRRAQYQLSQSNSSTAVNNATGNKDEGSPLNVAQRGNEVWKKLQVDPQTLTQWNANLRMWISQTILERLINEIDSINDEFQKHHLQDVQIGTVGLERLRKTAQTIQAVQYVPTLAALMPFLEATPNQEYLVKRIRELAKGGCMSEFKWNGGGNFNGKEWDDALPTDSAIIMHILSTYLDSQLLPLPSQPDARPFSKEHYVKMNEKVPVSPLTLAINQITEKPPHFRLIVGEDVFEVVKGHNNLFHTILLFLYFVNQKEHGMLGKVNMGKSGVNMLWIIDN